MNKYSVIILLSVLSAHFAQPVLGQTSVQAVRTYLEEVRNGSYATAPQEVWPAPTHETALLEALAPYQADSVVDIRAKAYNIAKRVGLRSQALPVRQTAAAQLAKGIHEDDSGLSGVASGALKHFSQSDFTPEAKARIKDAIRYDIPHLKQVAMLAGYLQIEGAIPQLRALLHAEQVSPPNKWAVRLALARLGDQEATNYIVNRVRTAEVNDDFVYAMVPGLAYTRHSAVFEYLETIIMSDEPTCSTANPHNDLKVLCGYRTMECIAPAIEDFPVRVGDHGDLEVDDYEQALRDVRAWFAAHNTYVLNTEVY